jgi:hypothetical protein
MTWWGIQRLCTNSVDSRESSDLVVHTKAVASYAAQAGERGYELVEIDLHQGPRWVGGTEATGPM